MNEKEEVVPSDYHTNNQKSFNEKWKDKNNYLEDGINNFKFEVKSNEEVYKNFRNNALFEIRHIKVDF